MASKSAFTHLDVGDLVVKTLVCERIHPDGHITWPSPGLEVSPDRAGIECQEHRAVRQAGGCGQQTRKESGKTRGGRKEMWVCPPVSTAPALQTPWETREDRRGKYQFSNTEALSSPLSETGLGAKVSAHTSSLLVPSSAQPLSLFLLLTHGKG